MKKYRTYEDRHPERCVTMTELFNATAELAGRLEQAALQCNIVTMSRLLKGLTINVNEAMRRERALVRGELKQLKQAARELGIKRP